MNYLPLRDLVENCITSYGGDPDSAECPALVAKVSNIAESGEFHGEFEPRSFTKRELERLRARPNDLFVVKSSGSKARILSGKTAIVTSTSPTPLVASNFLLRLRPRESTDPRYLWRVLNAPRAKAYIKTIVGAFTYPNLKWSTYGDLQIPLPPLAEQKRIAGILDAADALRAKRREALAQLDTLLQATFLDMFGDPVTNPKGWESVLLGNEIEFLTSGSRGWAQYYTSQGDIFIRIQNLKNGRLSLDDIAFVNAPQSAESRRTRVRPGDVLLSVTADLGRTAVVPEGIPKAHINQHLVLLRFREMNPTFVSYQLASAGGQYQFAKLNREGVKAGLNFEDVKSVKLLNPPSKQQVRFAVFIESLERQLALRQAHLAELDTLFASLQSRAFRGEL